MFPVIQRLQWTKWDDMEIFAHCLMHAMPSQSIYLNKHLPSKYSRCLLHILALASLMLGCTVMLSFKAPVSEDIEALDRSAWALLEELFSMPFQMECLGVTLLAGLASWLVRLTCAWIFYSYRLSVEHEPPSTLEARRSHLRFWHELAEIGNLVCIIGIVLCLSGALTLCANAPQPRAVGVIRAYLLVVFWTHLGWPFIKASARTVVLSMARGGRSCDGLLNVYVGAMEFRHVGVQTPEFLSWRVQKMVQEEELLRLIYEAADGECGTIPEMVRDQLEAEAENFTEHMNNQMMYPADNLSPGSFGQFVLKDGSL